MAKLQVAAPSRCGTQSSVRHTDRAAIGRSRREHKAITLVVGYLLNHPAQIITGCLYRVLSKLGLKQGDNRIKHFRIDRTNRKRTHKQPKTRLTESDPFESPAP
jgi:hypothetical protein